MKKQALALAVASAFAGSAFAQSVSINGIIDVGMSRIEKGGTADPDKSFTGSIAGTLATNQLNFVGTEDLGGGMKAAFKIQRQFNPATGYDSGVTNGANGMPALTTDFNPSGFDEVSVTLSGGFGSVSYGKQDFASRELGGIGRFGNFGRSTGFTRIGDERSDTLNYVLPAFQGLTLSLSYAGNQNSGVQTQTSTFGKSNAFGLTYANGPLRAGLAVANAKFSNTGAIAGQFDARDSIIAADYNLGFATIGVVRATSDLDKNADTTSNLSKRTNTSLNASVPLGNGLTLVGSYQSMRTSFTTSNNNATGYQVGVLKDLSKRTTVYAVYSSVDNQTGARFATRGMVAPAAAGDDPNAAVIGVRHSF